MSDSLGFLIVDVARLMRRAFEARARDMGVTTPQWKALFKLRKYEGCNQGQLAEKLDLDPMTTGGIIDRLCEAGLVERRKDPNDGRMWRLFLTPAAAPITERLEAVSAGLTEDLFGGMDDADAATLRTTLEWLRATLTDESKDD